VRCRRTVSAALLDKGTFPWYKRDDGGGVKSLILLVLCALPDNPFLGTIALAHDSLKCGVSVAEPLRKSET
jgi:hypothetical protein